MWKKEEQAGILVSARRLAEDVDYTSLTRTLREIDFDGWIVVELAHDKDFKKTRSLGESLRLSREHLRKTMWI